MLPAPKTEVDPIGVGTANGKPAGQLAPPETALQVTLVQWSPTPGASLTTAPSAAAGPRFENVTAYSVVLPATTDRQVM